MSQVIPKKLWRDIGTTKQKFDRDSDRSPSFDRSSLCRSKQAPSNSSQDLSLTKKPQIKPKHQIKNRQQIAFHNFCANVGKLGIELNCVPEQDDLQSVYNSGIAAKKEGKGIDNDRAELQLLEGLFRRKNSNIQSRLQKNKMLVFRQKFKRLKLNYCQIQRLIKYQFNQYTAELKKNQKLINSLLQQIKHQTTNNKQSINKLSSENYQLRKELLGAYDLIENLQQKIKTSNIKRSSLKTSQILISNDNQRDDENRTVKYQRKRLQSKNNEENNQSKKIQLQKSLDIPNTDHLDFQQCRLQLKKQSKDEIYDSQQMNKRERFKRYIKKKNDSKRSHNINDQELDNHKSEDKVNYIKFKKGFIYGNSQLCDSVRLRLQNQFVSNSNITTQKFCKNSPQNNTTTLQTSAKITKLKSQSHINFYKK